MSLKDRIDRLQPLAAKGVVICSLLSAIVLIALPWIYPATWGPKPAVIQWLISWGGLALVILAMVFAERQGLAVDWLRMIVYGWLMAAAISIGIALVQFLGLSGGLQPWVSAANPGEAFGNLRQRNQFASLTMLTLAAWCWANPASLWKPGTNAYASPWGWLFNIAVAAALGAGAALSASRVGFSELLLLMGFAVIWRDRGTRQSPALQALAGAFLAYSLVTVLLAVMFRDGRIGGLLGRFAEVAPSCTSRLVLWGNVAKLIGDAPWTGWGWGELDYAHFISLYPGMRFCDILDNAHDLPLHLAVELGLPAAVAISGVMFLTVLRFAPWQEAVPQCRMAWSVLAVIALHSMVEYPLWYGPFQVAVFLCVVVLWNVRVQLRTSAQPGILLLPHKAAAITALLALLVCTYAMVEYWRTSQIYLSTDQRDPEYRDDTLQKIGPGWLFRDQVRFAELSTTVLCPDNAEAMLTLAKDMLHFSPEPLVIEKLLDSAALLGRTEELEYYEERYKRAFPKEYRRWLDRNANQVPSN